MEYYACVQHIQYSVHMYLCLDHHVISDRLEVDFPSHGSFLPVFWTFCFHTYILHSVDLHGRTVESPHPLSLFTTFFLFIFFFFLMNIINVRTFRGFRKAERHNIIIIIRHDYRGGFNSSSSKYIVLVIIIRVSKTKLSFVI
jgi:hypothetical protein